MQSPHGCRPLLDADSPDADSPPSDADPCPQMQTPSLDAERHPPGYSQQAGGRHPCTFLIMSTRNLPIFKSFFFLKKESFRDRNCTYFSLVLLFHLLPHPSDCTLCWSNGVSHLSFEINTFLSIKGLTGEFISMYSYQSKNFHLKSFTIVAWLHSKSPFYAANFIKPPNAVVTKVRGASQCISMGSNLTLLMMQPLPLGLGIPLTPDLYAASLAHHM